MFLARVLHCGKHRVYRIDDHEYRFDPVTDAYVRRPRSPVAKKFKLGAFAVRDTRASAVATAKTLLGKV